MNRIKELRKRQNISQDKLARLLNVHQTAVSQWETGRTLPDSESLIRIANVLGTTVDHLLDNDVPDRESGVRIPVIGSSAAGLPINAVREYIDNNDPDTWEEISKNMAASGDYVAIRIKGDSMEPRIMDGDVIIVRLQSDAENGDTVIVMVNGDEATCKKINKSPEGIILISNNPNYDPMFFPNKDIQTLPVKIYGKVVEVRGKL